MRDVLWNIVLAAGVGRRLASVTGGIPKQFWSNADGPTLLEDTLTRTAPLAPPERTVIVVDRTHASFVAESPRLQEFDHITFQPCDRGTAAGVLLGLMRVVAADPEAVVMLTPSDHGIAEPDIFVDELRRAVGDLHRRQKGRAFRRHPGPSGRRLRLDHSRDALPSTDFSRDLLEVAEDLLLRTWPRALGWSDLGTPERLHGWRESKRDRYSGRAVRIIDEGAGFPSAC